MSIYAAFASWFAGACLTALWFDLNVDHGGLEKRARLAMDAMIFAASAFFPATWAWIAWARLRRRFGYRRRH